MGVSWGELGSLNAAQAARLGVLSDGAVRSLTAQSGTTAVTLAPLAGRSGTRAVRLTDADGTDYWLEYRAATARDGWLSTGNPFRLEAGVLLRQAGRNLPDTSLLLDGTPSAAAGWDADLQAALPVGAAVPVSDGDFTVVVRSVTADGAVVEVIPSAAPTAGPPAPPLEALPADRLMSGAAGTPAAPAAAAAPVEVPSVAAGQQIRTGTSALETAAVVTPADGLLLAAAALVVGAAVLPVLRRFRAGASRSR
jgi:hypothetical protein